VRVELSASGATINSLQTLEWRIGPRQADLTLSARVESSERGLFLLEWEVPESVRGVEVAGADVRSWSRSGSRVQVWLQRTVPSTRLTLSGWQPLDEPRKKPKLTEHPQLRLPQVRLRNGTQNSYVHLRAEPGLSLQPELVKGLVPLPAPGASPRELGYFERGEYVATIAAVPAPVRADVSALGFVELVDDELIYHALIDCQVHRAERRTGATSVSRFPRVSSSAVGRPPAAGRSGPSPCPRRAPASTGSS
jgi:hypothetical protein